MASSVSFQVKDDARSGLSLRRLRHRGPECFSPQTTELHCPGAKTDTSALFICCRHAARVCVCCACVAFNHRYVFHLSVEKEPELPFYLPAVQGCRSVDEFQCLNRIEEGTYGVVYRAKDKTKGFYMI